MIADITIHVESAERALERIDHSVTVLIQFLKVVVQDLTGLGIWRSTGAAIPAGIITLRLLEYAMIREVWLRLDDGRRMPFLPCLPMATGLPGNALGRRLFLWRCSHGLTRFSPSRLLGTYFRWSYRNLPVWCERLNHRRLHILLRLGRSGQHEWLPLSKTTNGHKDARQEKPACV